MFWEKMGRYYGNIAFEPSMVLQNAIVAVSIVVLLYDLKKTVKSITVASVQSAALFAFFVVVNGFLSAVNFHMLAISHALAISLYAALLCQYRPKSRIIMCCIFYATEMCMSQFAGTIPRLMTDLPHGGTIEIFVRNGFVVLTVGIAIYLRVFTMEKHEHIPTMCVTLVGVYSAVSALLAVVVGVNMWKYYAAGYWLAFCALGGMTLVGLILYYMIYRICLNHSVNMRLMAEKYLVSRDREMVRLSEKNLEDMQKIRHDMKNQFAYLKVMLQKGQYGELEKYFEDLEEKSLRPLSYIDCSNKNISAVLNLELAKAMAEGIELDTKLFVPKELPFSDSDVCSLLTNLIDNGIEACKRYKIKNGVIEVGISQNSGNLYVCVTNPIDSNEDTDKLLTLKTTKRDPMAHGYGTKIIKDIVRRYDGEINHTAENGRFIVDIMLNLSYGKGTDRN